MKTWTAMIWTINYVLYVHHIKRYEDMLDKYTVLLFFLVVLENQYFCEAD